MIGDEIDISGFVIRWSNIVIGIESALIVLPLNFFIVFLFRQAKPWSADEPRKQIEKLRLAATVVKPRHEFQQSLFNNIESVESGGFGMQYGKRVPSSPKTSQSNMATASKSLPDLSQSDLGKSLFVDSNNTFQDSSVFQGKIMLDDLHLCK